jgi:hypothetical protein
LFPLSQNMLILVRRGTLQNQRQLLEEKLSREIKEVGNSTLVRGGENDQLDTAFWPQGYVLEQNVDTNTLSQVPIKH